MVQDQQSNVSPWVQDPKFVLSPWVQPVIGGTLPKVRGHVAGPFREQQETRFRQSSFKVQQGRPDQPSRTRRSPLHPPRATAGTKSQRGRGVGQVSCSGCHNLFAIFLTCLHRCRAIRCISGGSHRRPLLGKAGGARAREYFIQSTRRLGSEWGLQHTNAPRES